MWKQILLWIVVAGVGGVVIFFSQQIMQAFGKSARAESNLGSTRNMYILIWFAMIVIGFLFMFGVIPLSSPIETATGV